MLFVKLLLLVLVIFRNTNGEDLVQKDFPLVHCETTKGPLTIEVHKDWSPLGAERFIDLVRDDFFTDIAFFRCVERFLTQFGISDNPEKKHWHNENIPDDPNLHLGIKKNVISFAGGGPNTRSTQLFIAFEDLDFLGNEPWETPFGMVIEGENTLRSLYKGYGDIPPFGRGPDQQKIHNQGNDYVRRNFPKTDFINSCELVYLPREELATKPAADAEIAAEIISENAESDAEIKEAPKEIESEAIYRLGDTGKAEELGSEVDRGSEAGRFEGDGLLDVSHGGGFREHELIFKALAFLTLLLLYLAVTRCCLGFGGRAGGIGGTPSNNKAR